MPQLIPVVLWLWVAYTVFLFRQLRGAAAVTVGLLAGWLLLPTATFDDSVARYGFPYWIMPVCLPSPAWDTKARAMGLGGLFGILLFGRHRLRELRPVVCDGFVLGWCLCPLVSGSANGVYASESLANAGYLLLCWGVPYLLGRLYLADPWGMLALARGVVAAGLLCVPVALLEWVIGPKLYAAAWGFHPYELPGATRYIGYRPVLFFEDGNQYGMWVATAAMVAAWLWWTGNLRKFVGLPGGLVAGVLVGQALLSQSAGAVILLGMGLAVMAVLHGLNRAWPAWVLLALVLGFAGARAANLIDAKTVVQRLPGGASVIDVLSRTGRGSLGWRLRVEERTTELAMQRPVFGWGRWDWWRPAGERPWGLLGLVLGAYGTVGLSLLLATFTAPLLRFLWQVKPRSWGHPALAPAAALAASLAINEVDAFLNPAYLLVFAAVSGGLAGFHNPEV